MASDSFVRMPPLSPSEETSSQLLSRLSRYYLECLSLDSSSGVSVLSDSRGNPQYLELSSLPGSDEVRIDHRAFAAVFRQTPRGAPQRTFYLGYPVRLRPQRSRSVPAVLVAEPLLLAALEHQTSPTGSSLRLGADPVTLNLSMLKSVSQGAPYACLEEAALLAAELGMDEATPPPLPSLARRLFQIRSEWDWREAVNPEELGHGRRSLCDLKEEGIYNCAIVVSVDRAKFTQGLEKELRKLQDIPVLELHQTALGQWLRGDLSNMADSASSGEPMIEPVPLNSEQRHAVQSALRNPLTVVTGPPGTGKSQVVSALLVNAAKLGMRVLFTSKNNKAVDVVEERVNRLGPNPILMRLGRGDYQDQLARYLSALLGSVVPANAPFAFQQAGEEIRRQREMLLSCQHQAVSLIALRNEVDQLEQISEHLRPVLGPGLFQSSAGLDLQTIRDAFEELSRAVRKADKRKQNSLVRCLWYLLGKSRQRSLNRTSGLFAALLSSIGRPLPSHASAEVSSAGWEGYLKNLSDRIAELDLAKAYHSKRSLLQTQPKLELCYQKMSLIEAQLLIASKALWENWIQMTPMRLTPGDRSHLANFLTLLQIIIQANQQNRTLDPKIFASYHRAFPNISKVLNCWAITSLSVSGRIPFTPGFFDLLIIDEASQCDIASVLPLLYRAKRVVVIGDPQQLKHISTVPVTQDVGLMIKHDLHDRHAKWSYSANSLFTLASSLPGAGAMAMLLDHHRSHPDIIEFSNTHFYQGRLRVATDIQKLNRPNGEQPLRWLHVTGQVTSSMQRGICNQPEADAVVSEIGRLVLELHFSGTLGVVTPFRGQANLITRLLHEHPKSQQLLQSTQLICESAHRFQGDERDVMIFSPVVADGIRDSALRFLKAEGNVFNVAITRARGTLIVVGDSIAASHSGIDYLEKFASYAHEIAKKYRLPGRQPDEATDDYPPVARPETVSDWERVFYRDLRQAGFKPIPQYQEEKFTLDFALFSGDRRLNIEIDGEQYHKDWDGELLYRDQLRNHRLTTLGWQVMRFWVYEVRDNPQDCIDQVREWFDRAVT